MMTEANILQRNKWLLKFFKTIFPDKIVIINSMDNPAVIYNNQICLSCYVQNYELRFMSKVRDGETVYSITLSETISAYDTDKIFSWFKNCEHRKVYAIKLNGTHPPLYLSGYNFIERETQTGRYPVFSRHNYKIYMNRENAQKILDQLKEDNYDTTVC